MEMELPNLCKCWKGVALVLYSVFCVESASILQISNQDWTFLNGDNEILQLHKSQLGSDILECAKPVEIIGMEYSPVKQTYSSGERVQYSCKNQNTLNAAVIYKCSKDNTWNAIDEYGQVKTDSQIEVPRCDQIPIEVFARDITSCPEPERPKYGSIDGDDYSIGKVIEYSCRPFFEIDGQSVLRCLAAGNWSAPFPSCVGICPYNYPQPRMDNGTIASPKYPDSYPPGDECQWSVKGIKAKRFTLQFKELLINNDDILRLIDGIPGSPQVSVLQISCTKQNCSGATFHTTSNVFAIDFTSGTVARSSKFLIEFQPYNVSGTSPAPVVTSKIPRIVSSTTEPTNNTDLTSTSSSQGTTTNTSSVKPTSTSMAATTSKTSSLTSSSTSTISTTPTTSSLTSSSTSTISTTPTTSSLTSTSTSTTPTTSSVTSTSTSTISTTPTTPTLPPTKPPSTMSTTTQQSTSTKTAKTSTVQSITRSSTYQVITVTLPITNGPTQAASKGGTHPGVIAAAVLTPLLLIMVVVLLLYLFWYRKKHPVKLGMGRRETQVANPMYNKPRRTSTATLMLDPAELANINGQLQLGIINNGIDDAEEAATFSVDRTEDHKDTRKQ